MAKQIGKVYLGYEDECIHDKNQGSLLNYRTNKIGGLPDWPPLQELKFNAKCPMCGLHRLLIVQCYAPLENSIYHRTLYLFACINPNCWTQSESWLCVRSQYHDKSASESAVVDMPVSDTSLSWCEGADDWDVNDNCDSMNGNIMNIDNAPCYNNQRNSDDDESNSFELETVEQAFGNLYVFDAHNANTSPIQGAVGANAPPVAAAEIEVGGDDPGLIILDSPSEPTNDITALLQLADELPPDLRSRLICGQLQFIPKYIYIEEERYHASKNYDKTNELIDKYMKDNGGDIEACGVEKMGGAVAEGDDEFYEEATPLHGDKLFHAFLMRLRKNPGHILRYSREEPPMLGAPLPSVANTPECPSVPALCPRCASKLICELQLVPAFAETIQMYNTIPLKHLHFLSVLIFTCSQSCWQPNDTLVTEYVVFQPEVV